jgi:hypothetical protein
MKKYFLILCICFFGIVQVTHAADFHQGSLFKIKIIADNEEMECEYKFPAKYQCEKSGMELEGKKARKQILLLFQQLHIHRGIKAEDMIAILQNKGYQNVRFLDVRWIDEHGRLFTWIWDKDKQ